MTGMLQGLKVVELGGGLSTAFVGNLLADFGAEVISIERPGGAQLRREPGFLFLARGKKSIVLDLDDLADAEVARKLLADVDVVVTQERVSERTAWGLDATSITALNPRLIYAQITAFGLSGSLADVKVDEALIAAKLGLNQAFAAATDRPGPSWSSTPWASWSGAQATLQGIFAALRERESSGAGQTVSTSLGHCLGGLDPWMQSNAALAQIFPDAFQGGGMVLREDGAPFLSYSYKLLVAITKDGHWLQFSQVQPRLFKDFMQACGLNWMYTDEKWSAFMTMCTDTVMIPPDASAEMRFEFWNMLYDIVQAKTLAEWQATFDEWPNVFAEVFRRGTDLLHHRQLEVEGQLATISDRQHGEVLQPGALIRFSETPAQLHADAPRLNEHGDELRERAKSLSQDARPVVAGAPSTLPLAGVTIMELGTFYAAPYGSTILTDLGARVIKVEALDGEPMRFQQAFPEAGAMKVLQGKESLALDLGSPDAKDVLAQIAQGVDIVMCSFRAGAADRLGVGFNDLIKMNPNIMYLDCPGFGVLPPYGARPAFAPTIGAGSGIAMRNVGSQIPETMPASHDELRKYGGKLAAGGTMSAAQPDGLAAFAVGTALAMAAYLQSVGVGGQQMLTTMLLSCGHALGETMVEFNGRWEPSTTDDEILGFSALERLYETADGWVTLSVTTDAEWTRLATAMNELADLGSDIRFANASLRAEHDGALTQALAGAFAKRSANEWEQDMLKAGVPLLEVNTGAAEHIIIGELGIQHGWVTRVESPVVGEYPRLSPFQQFSRSLTVALPGNTKGQHTRSVLTKAGFTEEQILGFAEQGLVQIG
ncbi:MAG: CoA transferase [Actinomycetota bacterium]|nr:CoA transferase [Actinomycetota bacterium]MDP2288021.1 CoA transferase [Actinomycetota bacterium]